MRREVLTLVLCCTWGAALASGCAAVDQDYRYDEPLEPAAADDPSWRAVESPSQHGLRSIHGTRISDVWAVGELGVILRFDGLEWSLQHSPARHALNAVWAASDELAWAVGDQGTIVRYDGRFWFREAVDTSVNLRAIWGFSPADVWAVGDEGTVMHYDGGAWVIDKAPTGLSLNAAWGTSSRDLFVAGVGDIFHFDGRRWSRAYSSGITTFVSIWASSPSDVWVLGDLGRAQRFDGQRWTAVEIRPGHEDTPRASDTIGIWGSASNDVWAVGRARPAGADPEADPLPAVLHFDGDRWEVARTMDVGQSLSALWGSSRQDVWAVGGDGLLLRFGR